MAQLDEDVDTGPGLETTHSCKVCEADRDHAQHLPNGVHAISMDSRCLAGQAKTDVPDSNVPDSKLGGCLARIPVKAQLPLGQNQPSTSGTHCDEEPDPVFTTPGTTPWDKDSEDHKEASNLHDSMPRSETLEEVGDRLMAARKAKRAERAAQISSLATLSLLLIAATLFLVLAYTGWNAIAAAVALFCASIAGYPFLHLLFYGLSSQMFTRTWNRMSAVDRFKWGQKGASLVHSGLMASVGLSVVLQGSWNIPDLMTQKDDRVAAFIGLELGYLIQIILEEGLVALAGELTESTFTNVRWDTGMEAYKHFAFGRSSSALHWAHHLTLLCSLPWYYKFQKADFFVGALFLWSTSTVPLHLRWFQVLSGMDKGVLYQLNNAALLLAFLACRIVSIPVLLHLYGCTQGWSLREVPFRIHWVFTAVCALVIISNTIWLVHLLQNAFKSRRKRRWSAKADSAEIKKTR